MTDLSTTIAPKSSQLNADDLIAGSMMITVTKVSAATAEQPIAINFENDQGKPYFPCKSMRRDMVQLWGADGSQYAGRSMTLYRDPGVKFGGIQVGGIRISHMSHIEKDVTMALTETKASRKPFTVKVLKQVQVQQQGATPAAPASRPARQTMRTPEQLEKMTDEMVNALDNAHAYEDFEKIINDPKFVADRRSLSQQPELELRVKIAEQAAADYFKQNNDASADQVPA